MENYAEIFSNIMRKKCDNYAEKTPDCAEISKINKVVSLAFSNV